MRLLSILLAYSNGGEALFVGLMTGLLVLLVSFIYNALKPKVQEAVTKITVNVDPNNVNGLIKNGYNELSKKNFPSAIESFQRAVNLSPNNCDALSGIAFAYHLNKDYINSKIAIETYQENASIDDAGNSMAALMTYLYGHHCFMEGNLEQAQTCKDNSKIMASLSDAFHIINELNLY